MIARLVRRHGYCCLLVFAGLSVVATSVEAQTKFSITKKTRPNVSTGFRNPAPPEPGVLPAVDFVNADLYIFGSHLADFIQVGEGSDGIRVSMMPGTTGVYEFHGPFVDVEKIFIFASAGDDNISIHAEPISEVECGPGNDTFYATRGPCIVQGGADDDTLIGGRSPDLLHGGWGNDRIRGNDGMDWLIGDAGEDELYSGSGMWGFPGSPNDDGKKDYLDGGADQDTFVVEQSVDEILDLTFQDDVHYVSP